MTHPMEMTLSVTGWNVDPEFLNDISFEVVHSQMTGDCFLVKMAFKNGTEARLEIEIKEGHGEDAFDALTEAMRIPRMGPLISGDKDDAA